MRDSVFHVLSNEVLQSTTTLTGKPLLDYETIGMHYYARHTLVLDERDYSPPHKDGGTLTILVRENDEFDGLEIADLETTNEVNSERIGLEASFLPVPVAAHEVLVFVGTRMQRILGADTVRACVHRVRAPTQVYSSAKARFSLAVFCAPPS